MRFTRWNLQLIRVWCVFTPHWHTAYWALIPSLFATAPSTSSAMSQHRFQDHCLGFESPHTHFNSPDIPPLASLPVRWPSHPFGTQSTPNCPSRQRTSHHYLLLPRSKHLAWHALATTVNHDTTSHRKVMKSKGNPKHKCSVYYIKTVKRRLHYENWGFVYHLYQA